MIEKDAQPLRWITWFVVGLHLAMLLAALPNYRASVDSAYHTAMGRQYGIHGVYFWDNVHFGPAHRPNLQGPAVHLGIGLIGRLLGGEGDDYRRANDLLGIGCWLAGVGTVVHFARRASGDLAALLAAAVVTGGANTGVSLSMNLPVFWMIIATSWAIHFFVARQFWLAIGFASLACYCHLGGFATVPVGLIVATLCQIDWANRWQRLRELTLVGGGTLVATSPYWIHLMRYRAWYVGVKSDTTWWIDPLADLFWLVGLLVALRGPRKNAFFLAWAAAPLVWIAQDASRFILVSALCGAAIGSVAVAEWLQKWKHDRYRRIAAGLIVYVATAFPLGIPALGAEVFWLLKSYPALLDWDEMRANAAVIREHQMGNKLLQGYTSYVPSAISVWADIEAEKGHWVEVQPAIDPSNEMSVADKTYVIALPPGDEVLVDWQSRGWVKVFGGGAWSCVVQFRERSILPEATAARDAIWARETAWLAEHAEHNSMGNFMAVLLDPQELPRRRAVRSESRQRMTRMQLSTLLLAYALEPVDPSQAQQARDDSRALGWIAALLGDEMALDYRSAESHAQLKRDLGTLVEATSKGEPVDEPLHRLLENYLGAARGGLFSSKSRP